MSIEEWPSSFCELNASPPLRKCITAKVYRTLHLTIMRLIQ